MSSCRICAYRLLPEDVRRTACWRCTARMRGWLRELPWQIVLLEAMLVPDSQPATGRIGGTGMAHSPAPARGDVLNLLGPAAISGTISGPGEDQIGPTPIAATLTPWLQLIAEERHATITARSPTQLGQLLALHLDWAAHRAWITDLWTELDDLTRRVRRITSTEPKRRPCRAPCRCGAFGLVAEDWAEYIECTVCARLYTAAEYDTHAAQVMPRLDYTALAIFVHSQKLRTGDNHQPTEGG